MEVISPRPLTGAQELFLRAEELERLVAIYKLKLCGEEMASLNHGGKWMEQSRTEVLGDQRGRFYDVYMRKREERLREEWLARGAEKETEMRGLMESLASSSSTMMNKGKAIESNNDHSSRKLSLSGSIPSSTSQSSATTAHNPTIRSSSSASLRKENSKSSARISHETTLQRSVARSQSSNDRMSLVKDIKARRSQSLRKNSASLGEPKDFMNLNYDHDTSTPPMNTNLLRHGAPKPLLRKSNGAGPTTGLSKAKLRIPIASQGPISEESQLQKSKEMLNAGNDQVDSMRIEDVRHHRFESSSHIVESHESSNPHIQNFLSNVQEASDFDSSVDTPCFDQAAGDSDNMNRYQQVEPVRVRKKWGSIERPFVAVDASTHPIMDLTKGIKRFLKFGKRSEGMEMHNDKKYGHDSENYLFEDSKNSRIGQIPSSDSFNEDETHSEQVNRPGYPSHSASLKEKEKHPLANSPKQRVLSSLPPFYVRENEKSR